MKYEETCSQGSFIVWGTGFRFEYEAENKLLSVSPLDEKRAITRLKIDRHLARDPLGYVESLDKTNRIKALMYSNNTTVNLAEVLDSSRITSLVKTTARISRCAFDLSTKNYRRFAAMFCEDFDLKSIKIKKFYSRETDGELYLGRIQTRYNNSVCARACSLVGLTAALSDRTLRDLITMEFGHSYNNSAHALLNASAKLSTISRILDENFIPERKLDRYKTLSNSLDSIHSKLDKKG